LVLYEHRVKVVDLPDPPGRPKPAVRDFIRSRIVDEFSLDDIRSATPASDPLAHLIPDFEGLESLISRPGLSTCLYARRRKEHHDSKKVDAMMRI
jgi:hypothetical protein